MNRKKKQHLEDRKNNVGLIGTKLEITDDLEGKSFSACMVLDWKKIRMDFQKDLDLIPDSQTASFARKMGITDPELTLGEDILEHECGHRENRARTMRGCPYDIETHDLIKSEIAKTLKSQGKENQTDMVTNCFEDILNNINCRNYTDYAGQTLFWNNQGLFVAENQKFSSFYEFFVRTNLFLGNEVKSHTLISRFFSGNPKILPAVKGFLEDLCYETREYSSIGFNQKPGFQKLFTRNLEKRRELWEKLARSFAEKSADLLEPMPEEMFGSGQSYSSGSSGEKTNKKNKGNSQGKEEKDPTKDQEKGSSGSGDSEDQEQKSPREEKGQNPFDEELKDPRVQEKLAMGRYKAKKGPSYHADLQDQLYSLYKASSREIRIETSSPHNFQSMPLVHFGKRFATEDDKKLKFKGIGFNPEGKLAIKTARHHLDFPAQYKNHPTKFPDLKIAIMDRSGSMSESPDGNRQIGDTSFIPWGDKSKYHFALKGYFGIDNYLERQGIAPFIKCSVLGLSGEEAIRGKSKEVAKKLLHHPGGNFTTLDVSQLEKELEESALVISLSDGQMNMSEDTSSLDEKLKKCDYVHLQIGGETAYSRHIQSLGKPVIFVKGDDDLPKEMIRFIKGYYTSKKSGGQNK